MKYLSFIFCFILFDVMLKTSFYKGLKSKSDTPNTFNCFFVLVKVHLPTLPLKSIALIVSQVELDA